MTTDINYAEIKEVREIIRQWDETMKTFPAGYNYDNLSCDPEFIFLKINIHEYLSVWKKFKEGKADEREQLISHEIAMYLACDNKEDTPERLPLLRNITVQSLIDKDGMTQGGAVRLVAETFGSKETTVKRDYQTYKKERMKERGGEFRKWLRKDAHPSFRDLLMSAVERNRWYVLCVGGDFLPIPPVAE
ncbi:hypothetical protein [Vibrio alginolyticus]|uniref:hypothetical protein n=1 Tax=Vibrio alginolyticus TaxID=663 RepID=UPI00211A2763|nr:hypothetical protein [Vibrio alginolyticus]MCQ9071187.1 hypothetical protein [Vibrio alginolyticus]